ncbi:TonB-dependent receptor [Sphingomonas sp. KRR8]|uniref:TonB-dependent receptor n=1 Tax=Sphingomonas sp. KRR8 TaxID=2942996 RepID=UPI0020205165|nr:TonB-dependent receptor [Sphingomonas sp. KRR8]URD60620.1 TonB-dependent receptor [Sphingomonas sp. KRR8]
MSKFARAGASAPSALRHTMVALLLAGTATPVFAQADQTTAPGSGTPAGIPSTSGEAPRSDAALADQASRDRASRPANGGLTEIVVTATKRETNLQKTPIAISVVDTKAIQDRHIQSLINLADGSVPSLRVATFEARQSALTIGIRGIVPFDQNQTAREPGVGVYVDGVYLGRSQGLNAALFDVERIEVLRGPQGTLFGRNTEGGALSIVTAAPTGVFSGRVLAGVGNYGGREGEMHINLPSFANIAIKVDAVYQHQDPTTRNPASGQYGWNYYNRVGGRVAARWKPVDGLTVDLAYDQAKDENTPFYSQLIDYNPLGRTVGQYVLNPTTNRYVLVAPGTPAGTFTACTSCIAPLSPLVQVSGDHRMSEADLGVIQQPSVDQTHGFTGAIRYKLTPGLELRSITAWRGVETHQWDGSAGAHRSAFVPNGQFGRYSLSELFQHQFSQEFQIVGSLPQLDYVLGANYFNEHVSEAAATPNPQQWNATGTAYTFVNQVAPNPLAPITSSNQGWDRRDWFIQRDSQAVGKSWGVFGQATYTPAGLDILHITAGGRYSHDKRDGSLFVLNGTPVPYQLHYKNGRFDPLAIVSLDAAPSVNLYAKYSSGFRAGGANARSATFRAFDPESVKAYEVGAKADFFDHRARLNVAAYLMNRKNTQIDFDFVDTTQFLPNGTPSPTFNLHTEETVNVPGKSKIKGVEVELTVKPVEGVTLGASYSYTDIKVPATPNPLAGPNFGQITQVFTVYTPKHAGSAYANWDLPLTPGDYRGAKVRLHLDGNWAGPQYSFQAENVKTDKSFIMNGSLALADVPLSPGVKGTLNLWARNLLNEDHIYRRSNANAAVIGDYANFNAPRTFGLQGIVSFAPPPPMPVVAAPPPPPPPSPPAPAPATQTCADGSVILATEACPSPPPPPLPPPPAPERG